MRRDDSSMSRTDESFLLDGQYLRREARDAVRTFMAPFSGVYAAATGRHLLDASVKPSEAARPR